MKLFRHIILALTALILASCAVDEFWEGTDYAEGEEVVMTFKPRFEDFESVTKAIGDGSQVNQLLVHVYEEGSDQFEEKTYDITSCQVQQEVKIPFFYGKKYMVYFWAYKSGNDSPYTVSNIGLKGGVSVNYPDDELGFNALESLDAFYAVSDVDLSNGRTMDINLTRPFAQVNLVADKTELLKAQASKVEFTINVAKTFNLASQKVEGTTGEQTFTFTSADNFQSTEEINGNVYLGTTYIFVPSSGKVTGKVKLYAGDNVLKSAENIEIPLVGNKRTNLVFSGFQVIVPDWNPDKVKVPEGDGWITITEPEQLAALLMTGTTKNTQVRIGSTLNMEKMPQDVKNQIVGKSFSSLTLDGTGHTIKNFSAPAFFANATNLKVSKLTLENVHITAATHVGVLVNELKGNGTFTNVTVKGSSATTTNGAAGGFVGRSIRTSEKERSETLALTFTGCRIEVNDDKKIVATGSLAEGKFVGLFSGYDNGEKLVFTNCSADANATVADYSSRYVEGNEGEWLAVNDYSDYNGFLGDEKYLRGMVYFVGEDEATIRFCPKWDGITTVEPLLANPTYDGTNNDVEDSNKFAVYSPFDLAGVRKKTAKPEAIYLMQNVDMFGYGPDGIRATPLPSRPSLEISDDNLFTPFEQVSYLEGNSFTIHNLSVEEVHNTNLGGTAFIRMASGTTTHQNLTLSNPDIKAYSTDPISDGNAYAGTLVCTTSGSYNALNINILGGNLFAICKAGGLCGRISTGTTNLSNCTVNGLTLSNYDTGYFERFLDYNILGYPVQIDFNSDGEIGGLVGFIIGNASITNCTVENCNFYCTGEKDWTLELLFAAAKVPGRHVNEFIGDIRTTNGETVSITNYTIKNNNMHTSQTATNGEKYRSDKYKEFKSRSAKTWDCVGFVYAVTIQFNDTPGNVEIDNSTVFVSESLRK